MNKLFACFLIFLISKAGYTQKTYYVDANYGNDHWIGNQAEPFKTIQKVADILNAGDTVIVKDGIYKIDTTNINNKNSSIITYFRRKGTPAQHIIVKAEHKQKAIIDGEKSVIFGFSFDTDVGYIEIQGFKFTNLTCAIDITRANNIIISKNEFTDIGRVCKATNAGYFGISENLSNNIIIEKNRFHNIGRLFPGENGCNISDNNANHDHAIYIAGGRDIIIKNNIFDSIVHGWGVHIYNEMGVRPFNIIISNNTFFDANPARDGQIIMASPGIDNAYIINNIFYKPRGSAIYIDQENDTTIFNNIKIKNNIIYSDNGGGTATTYPQKVDTSNNLNVDPKISDPSAYDASLLYTSPAIDAGMDMSIYGVNDDYVNTNRPCGARFDIGAYEFFSKMLPINLLSFQAVNKKDHIYLSWATANKNNSTIFDIEKSTNGRDFKYIGKIKNSNSYTDKQSYSYIDLFPTNGVNFYRLKQTNINGAIEYSNIVSVNYNSIDEAIVKIISPDNIEIIYKKKVSKAVLYNSVGQRISNFPIFEGCNFLKLNRVKSGIYFINIDNIFYKILL